MIVQHLKIVSAPLTIFNSASFDGLEYRYASLARPLGPPVACLRGLLVVFRGFTQSATQSATLQTSNIGNVADTGPVLDGPNENARHRRATLDCLVFTSHRSAKPMLRCYRRQLNFIAAVRT